MTVKSQAIISNYNKNNQDNHKWSSYNFKNMIVIFEIKDNLKDETQI